MLETITRRPLKRFEVRDLCGIQVGYSATARGAVLNALAEAARRRVSVRIVLG